MKHGFRIVYHKSIQNEDLQGCLEFLQGQVKNFKNGYGCRAESGAFFRRGIFGLTVDEKRKKYTFKRLVKNRRIFGIVPIDMLERVDGQPIDLNQCMCAEHRGGQRVKIVGGFQESDWVIYYEEGDIKG